MVNIDQLMPVAAKLLPTPSLAARPEHPGPGPRRCSRLAGNRRFGISLVQSSLIEMSILVLAQEGEGVQMNL